MSRELKFIVTLQIPSGRGVNSERIAKAIQRVIEWVLGSDVEGTEILNEDLVESVKVVSNQ